MEQVDATVIVSTFGDESWKEMALGAIESAEKAGAKEVIYNHGETLHEARNAGLFAAKHKWVIHLDADDYLTPDFIKEASVGVADVKVPAICYSQTNFFNTTTATIPRVPGHSHICSPECLKVSNYIIVGAMARAELLQTIGGWRDYEALEDFDLWQRCWLAGASFKNVPKAIYLARSRPNSRNKADMATMRRILQQICSTNMPGGF